MVNTQSQRNQKQQNGQPKNLDALVIGAGFAGIKLGKLLQVDSAVVALRCDPGSSGLCRDW